MRNVAVVKLFERKAELGAKCFQRDLAEPREAENMIRGGKNGWQVVHQRA